jgi:hypothetical protein
MTIFPGGGKPVISSNTLLTSPMFHIELKTKLQLKRKKKVVKMVTQMKKVSIVEKELSMFTYLDTNFSILFYHR